MFLPDLLALQVLRVQQATKVPKVVKEKLVPKVTLVKRVRPESLVTALQ
jgi:hypothetical protein